MFYRAMRRRVAMCFYYITSHVQAMFCSSHSGMSYLLACLTETLCTTSWHVLQRCLVGTMHRHVFLQTIFETCFAAPVILAYLTFTSPHLCVGFLFLIPLRRPLRLLLPLRLPLHTTCHTILCHTPSFTHNFATHFLSHTALPHTIFQT